MSLVLKSCGDSVTVSWQHSDRVNCIVIEAEDALSEAREVADDILLLEAVGADLINSWL